MMWRRRSLLVLAAIATLAFALVNAPAQASTSRASYAERHASVSAVAPTAGMKCPPGTQESSAVKHCVVFKVEPFSASALTPADRSRRSAAMIEIAAAAKSGNTQQVTAMPLRQSMRLYRQEYRWMCGRRIAIEKSYALIRQRFPGTRESPAHWHHMVIMTAVTSPRSRAASRAVPCRKAGAALRSLS